MAKISLFVLVLSFDFPHFGRAVGMGQLRRGTVDGARLTWRHAKGKAAAHRAMKEGRPGLRNDDADEPTVTADRVPSTNLRRRARRQHRAELSCEGNCGGSVEHLGTSIPACFCDEFCGLKGDCCSNVNEVCTFGSSDGGDVIGNDDDALPPQHTPIYTPQLCGRIMEPHVCGTSILPSFCDLETTIGSFARSTCPVLCNRCLDGTATTSPPTTAGFVPQFEYVGPCTNDTISEPPVCGSVITSDACGLDSADGLFASRTCPRICGTCDLVTLPPINRTTPCNAILEPAVCGVQIRQSACKLAGGDGEFTQRACPRLCGVCNSTTAVAVVTDTTTAITTITDTSTSTTQAATTLSSTTVTNTFTSTTTASTHTTNTATSTTGTETGTTETATGTSTSQSSTTTSMTVTSTTTSITATSTTVTSTTVTSTTVTSTTVTSTATGTTLTTTSRTDTISSTTNTLTSTTSTTTSTTVTITTTSTTDTTTTFTTTTYKPSICRGVPEAVACGSRILKTDCNRADHAAFAKEHCPIMCGVDCTTSSSTATSTTRTESTTTETSATSTTKSTSTTTITVSTTTRTSATSTTKTSITTTTKTTTTKTTTTKTTTTVYDPGNVDCVEYQNQCTAACERARDRGYRIVVHANKRGRPCRGPNDCDPGEGSCPPTTSTATSTTETNTATSTTSTTTSVSTTSFTVTSATTTTITTTTTHITSTTTLTTTQSMTTTTTRTTETLTAAKPTTSRTESKEEPCADDIGCTDMQLLCSTDTVMGSNIRALCPVMCGTCPIRTEHTKPAASSSSSTSTITSTRSTPSESTTSPKTSLEPSSISLGNKASKIIISTDGENTKLSAGSIAAIVIGALAFMAAVAIMCRRNACVCNITVGASGHEVAQESDPHRNRTVESFQNPVYENPDAIVHRRYHPATPANLVAMETPSRLRRLMPSPLESPSRLRGLASSPLTPITPALPPRNMNRNDKMAEFNAQQMDDAFQPPPYTSAIGTSTPTSAASYQPYASTIAAAAAASPTPRTTYFELDGIRHFEIDGIRNTEV